MEAYVDDIVVKSKKFKNHMKGLNEVFGVLRRYKVKLSLEKSVFGISAETFLEFIIT